MSYFSIFRLQRYKKNVRAFIFHRNHLPVGADVHPYHTSELLKIREMRIRFPVDIVPPTAMSFG
jgi:hypothetical protein